MTFKCKQNISKTTISKKMAVFVIYIEPQTYIVLCMSFPLFVEGRKPTSTISPKGKPYALFVYFRHAP